MNFDVNFRLNVIKSLVKRDLVVILMFQNGAFNANATLALFAVEANFLYVCFAVVCPSGVILHIAGLEIADIFYMMATKNFPFLMNTHAVIA